MESAGPAENIIELHDVRFNYESGGRRTFALNIGALSVRSREHVACIGPSGTGKTTLINLISGIFVPDSGRVMLHGEISSLDEDARRRLRIANIGLVFQEFELLEYLSALDNILLPYHISSHLTMTREIRERADRLAGAMRINHVLKRDPKRLSQGERQRVAICRALVTEPKLVIADEPTGNLDPETAEITLDLLFEQVREHGATLLMVTHNHGVLNRFERTIDIREFTAPQPAPV